jgi:HK97 family phage prohead protease
MNVELRSIPAGDLEVRHVGKTTRIRGYAGFYGARSLDLGGFVEEIAPGAFKRVANSDADVLALFDHQTQFLLGRRSAETLKISEDSGGLHYEVEVNAADPLAVAVAARIARGDVSGSSFAFRIAPNGDEWGLTETDYPLRTVKEVSMLRDVGPVSAPAYPDTTAGMRSALAGQAERRSLDLDHLVEAARAHQLDAVIRGANPAEIAHQRPSGFWESKRAQIEKFTI